MANLVTLEISFASGGADVSAKLCWKNDEGAEQEYARVQLRARVTQETFPGHRWLLRGEQTGTVLWEGVAAARPAVQPIVVHFRERAVSDDDEGDGEAAEGDGEAATADGDGADAAPTGVWTGADGLHRFERLPRPGRDLSDLKLRVPYFSKRQPKQATDPASFSQDARPQHWAGACPPRALPAAAAPAAATLLPKFA